MINSNNIFSDKLDLSTGKIDMEDFYNSLVTKSNELEGGIQPIDNVSRADQAVQMAEANSVDIESSNDFQTANDSANQQSMESLGSALDQQSASEVQRIDEAKFEGARAIDIGSGGNGAGGQSQGATGLSIKLSNYGYASDKTPDSYSSAGIGHASNRLVSGRSVAITKRLASKMNIQRGAVLEINTTKGKRIVTYDDTVPSYDKRTGALPDTIDIYRKNGSNSWGGKVEGVRMLRQGKKGIGGKKYNQFVEENYRKATS